MTEEDGSVMGVVDQGFRFQQKTEGGIKIFYSNIHNRVYCYKCAKTAFDEAECILYGLWNQALENAELHCSDCKIDL